MPLDEPDLDRVRALVAAEVDRRLRRRRWPLIALLAGIAIGVAALAWLGWIRLQADLARREQEYAAVRTAYQRELARNQAWRRERAAAERATGYQAGRTQAAHEAAELQQALSLIGKRAELTAKWERMDLSKPEAMQEMARDLEQVLDQGLGAIGRIVLRDTDPERGGATLGLVESTAAATRP